MVKAGLRLCRQYLSDDRAYSLQARKTLTKVKVAEVTHSIFYAPLYVAESKGFFKEEGLDVNVNTTQGGDKTMTSLLSNGSDIALVGSETSIYVEAQGSRSRH